MIDQLFPMTGAKKHRKYGILAPSAGGSPEIVEPFMGAASRSLSLGLPCVLGEIDINKRAIARIAASRRRSVLFISQYEAWRDCFFSGLREDLIVRSSKLSMREFRAAEPIGASILDERWRSLLDSLAAAEAEGTPTPALWMLCIKLAFSNNLRPAPGGGYNPPWHCGKLKIAYEWDPAIWVNELQEQAWSPKVCPSWQAAIAAAYGDSYCLLDPPYIAPEGDRKLTPTYTGHGVAGEAGEATYRLAVDSAAAALAKGFPLVHLTNYYSPRLDSDLMAIAAAGGYLCHRIQIGELSTINSKTKGAGDPRPKPIECLWIFEPWKQLAIL